MEEDYKSKYPKVGIGVMVFKDGKVLLGRRKGSHGAGEHAWPGGHLEYMESVIDCAKREVKEETGMEIENIQFVRVLNLKDYPPKHYIDICVRADWKSGNPEILEPKKCDGWAWYDINNLPEPVFTPVRTAVEAYKNKKYFFD